MDLLTEIILSDTLWDPGCTVYCMDDRGPNPGGRLFTDDDGIICRWGDGNTRAHAYENRIPLRKSFAEATDRERRSYLGLNENVKITIREVKIDFSALRLLNTTEKRCDKG